MRKLHKPFARLFLPAVLIFTVTAFNSCEKNRQLTSPFADARISLQLVFPDETKSHLANNLEQAPESLHNKSSLLAANTGNNALLAFDDVRVSVLDSATNNVVIKEQVLTIANNRASGELSIPVTGEQQSFKILVTASDSQELLFLVGDAIVTLLPGQFVEEPVFIILQAPNLVAPSGTVQASSTRSPGNFSPRLAVDFEFGTSWLSAGSSVDGSTSTFTWNGRQDDFFTAVGIVNNSRHTDPTYQNGFGFGTITFQVFSELSGKGEKRFEQTVPYPQSKDLPVVNVAPLATGRSIRLLLNEPQNPEAGGFSELLIVGSAEPVVESAILSNFVSTFLQVNDSTNCNIFNGPVGSLFEFKLNYSHPQGSVTTGTVVNVSWVSLPSGMTGGFTVSSPTITGDGFQGAITVLTCWLFGNESSFDVTVTITDASGQTSNGVTLNVPRPEGGNTAPFGRVEEHFNASKTRPDAATCEQN
ncbi:MAG: hypothetical protein ACE5HS_10065 [bacterium]